MPILKEETSLFPETLLDDDFPFDGGEVLWPGMRQWWVLHTRARQEKALARNLICFETPFFLPLVKKTCLVRGRRVCAHLPLFPGYLFVFGTEDDRARSLRTNRVAQTLKVDEPARLVFDLRQIRRLIESNAPLTVESRLGPGHRVRVRKGPFAGLEGTVTRRRGKTRLIVVVDFLQQGASVEMEDFLVEPID
jgi:transcription antitermination factor NusG